MVLFLLSCTNTADVCVFVKQNGYSKCAAIERNTGCENNSPNSKAFLVTATNQNNQIRDYLLCCHPFRIFGCQL